MEHLTVVITPTRPAFKLLTLRRNGTLGPLFINRRQVITPGEWMRAEDHKTKGFAHRPGWHVAPAPFAPHLTEKGRIWMHVEISDYVVLVRPDIQGKAWWIARWMRVLDPVEEHLL